MKKNKSIEVPIEYLPISITSICFPPPSGNEMPALQVWQDGAWQSIELIPIGAGNCYLLTVPLMVPGLDRSSKWTDFTYSQALILRFNEQEFYSYVWYENTDWGPKMWVLQAAYAPQLRLGDNNALLSFDYQGQKPSNRPGYIYLDRIGAINFPGMAPVSAVSVLNEWTSSMRVKYTYANPGMPPSEMPLKEFAETEVLSGQYLPLMNPKPIEVGNVNPSINGPISLFWINGYMLIEEDTRKEITPTSGVMYDPTGYPYVAQNYPVLGYTKPYLLLNMVTDGNILVIGTMDLDPETK